MGGTREGAMDLRIHLAVSGLEDGTVTDTHVRSERFQDSNESFSSSTEG